MKLCSKDCIPICDFCRFFYFGEDPSVYMGNGHCKLHDKKTDPCNACKEFECMNCVEEEKKVTA